MHRQEDGTGEAIATDGIGAGLAALVRAAAIDARPPFELTVDLGDAVGSARWWRGAATLAAMLAALTHLAATPLPDLAAVSRVEDAHATETRTRADRVSTIPASVQDPPPIHRADASRARRIGGLVGGGLYRSMRAAGVPVPTVVEYLRAIGPRIDFDVLTAEDRFDIVIAPRRAATSHDETGLLYAGIQHGSERLQLLRWPYAGEARWFAADGVAAGSSGLTMPVAGARLTSGFGMRLHPILGLDQMHQGVDLAVPYGTPIVAAADGVVRFAGWHGGHGNFVQIAHAGGLGTGYGHMSSIVVAPGSAVRRGELIGYVGATGLTTGPHLHLEVYRDGAAIDPASARFTSAVRLSGDDLARFQATLARLRALPAMAAVPSPAG